MGKRSDGDEVAKLWRFEAREPTRATGLRVGGLIRQKGMLTLDAFTAFNYNRNGVLTCSELNSGLWWLGLQLEVPQVHNIVRSIDRDNDGIVDVEEIRDALAAIALRQNKFREDPEALEAFIQVALREIDANSDDVITVEEVEKWFDSLEEEVEDQ